MLEESLKVKPSSEHSTGDVGCVEAQCLKVLLGGTLFLIVDVEILVRLDVILEFCLKEPEVSRGSSHP